MKTPTNSFKAALSARRLQIGLWSGLADGYCAEICAGAGFDWMALDAEHAPNDLRTLLAQLQAVAPYPVAPVVRATIGDSAHIKQLLDLGAQTLLVPIVETAEQAAGLVRATRYPPQGIRGVGSALARASRWNRYDKYLHEADEQICLIVQIETPRGIDNLDAIARLPGVDGVFIGPADLSASMGYRGQPDHPEVQSVMEQAVARILAAGKAAGTLLANETLARKFIALGCSFVAVGVDTLLLARATQELARRFRMRVPRMRRFDQSLPMALLAARESIMAFFRPHLNELGLTEQQWRVIRVLREHDELEFHELASITKLLPPSLSGMLTRLERLRLIKRRKLRHDQRRLHIALSPEGVARFDVASRQMERIYREIEQRFGKRRLASLFNLLRSARELQPGQPGPVIQRRKNREPTK